MRIESVTYAASCFDFTLESGVSKTPFARQGLAAFLLRLMAYFKGRLASLPPASQTSVTVIDTSLDGSSEPLIKVRMNRHLSRRLRWLIRRGRVQRSSELRVATAADEARCNLTPGQFNEYCIRAHRMCRIHIYGLGMGRRALRLCAILMVALQGDTMCLRRAGLCSAPLTPD